MTSSPRGARGTGQKPGVDPVRERGLTAVQRGIFGCLALLPGALSCHGVGGAPKAGATGPASTAAPKIPAPPPPTQAEVKPDHPLSPAEAARYAISLINRDRASQGLGPVTWDPTAAAAATRHARDMATHGITAHWGTDGSTPEIRYTEAGGTDRANENVGCLADGKTRGLRAPPFEAESIAHFHDLFFNEKPPADGHRKNILNPHHTHVGIGFAAVEGFPVVCLVHEFVDDYGDYAELPRSSKKGDKLKVEGTLRDPVKFGGIGVGFEPKAKPRSVEDLAKTGSYAMPAPFVSYFPAGYVTPLPVKTDGKHFSLDLPVGREKGPGEYAITIFVQFPGSEKLVPVSMRTVAVP
jgi:uncharacterized protein YkwD